VCPSPDPLTGLFLWQNIIGVWPADGRPRVPRFQSCASVYTPMRRESRPRVRRQDFLERSGRRPSSRQCTAGSTRCSTDLSLIRSANSSGRIGAVTAGRTLWAKKLLPTPRARSSRRLPGHGSCGRDSPGSTRTTGAFVDYGTRRITARIRRPRRSTRQEPQSLHLVRTALTLRRENPSWFDHGEYRPHLRFKFRIRVHLVGFSRGPAGDPPMVVALATRHSLGLSSHGWRDTRNRPSPKANARRTERTNPSRPQMRAMSSPPDHVPC